MTNWSDISLQAMFSLQLLISIASLAGLFSQVILATNVAESSITIPKVDIIIDFCVRKVMSWNEIYKMDSLSEVHINKFSANQRAGRTGKNGSMNLHLQSWFHFLVHISVFLCVHILHLKINS